MTILEEARLRSDAFRALLEARVESDKAEEAMKAGRLVAAFEHATKAVNATLLAQSRIRLLIED